MARRFQVARAAAVVTLGLVAFGVWLAEVVWVKGWPGLQWLGGYPYAAIVVAVLVAVAVLVVVGVAGRAPLNAAGFLAAASGVGIVCFELARESIFALYSRDHLAILNANSSGTKAAIAALPISAVLAALGLYACARFLLRPISAWTILYLILAFGLVLPAAMLTIRVFPAIHGGYTDYVHSVKMGYHSFWAVVLAAGAVALGARSSKRSA